MSSRAPSGPRRRRNSFSLLQKFRDCIDHNTQRQCNQNTHGCVTCRIDGEYFSHTTEDAPAQVFLREKQH